MATPPAATGYTTDTGAIASAKIIKTPPKTSNTSPNFHVSFSKYVFKMSFLNVSFGNDFVPFFCNAFPIFMDVEERMVIRTAKNPAMDVFVCIYVPFIF